MDGESFDAVVQRLAWAASRRGILRAGVGALASVALGVVGLSSGTEVAARRRRRKRCGAGGPCRVFVTSSTFSGILGGLAGADTICQDLADLASLRGTYKAWLSDSTASPRTRFVHSTGPYLLVDGTQIAANWAALTDGALRAPITLTDFGNPVSDAHYVWTFTNVDGSGGTSNEHCENWSSGSPTDGGFRGVDTEAGSNWTQSGTDSCHTSHHLYCFQQSGR